MDNSHHDLNMRVYLMMMMRHAIWYHKKFFGLLILTACVMFTAFPLLRAHAQDTANAPSDNTTGAQGESVNNQAGTDFTTDVAQAQQDANPVEQLAVTLNQDVTAGDVSTDPASDLVIIGVTPVVDTLEEAQSIANSTDLTTPALDPAIDALPSSDNLSTGDIQAIDAQVNSDTISTGGSTDTSGSQTGGDTSSGTGSDTAAPASDPGPDTTTPATDITPTDATNVQ